MVKPNVALLWYTAANNVEATTQMSKYGKCNNTFDEFNST